MATYNQRSFVWVIKRERCPCRGAIPRLGGGRTLSALPLASLDTGACGGDWYGPRNLKETQVVNQGSFTDSLRSVSVERSQRRRPWRRDTLADCADRSDATQHRFVLYVLLAFPSPTSTPP
jgi:hypothetical protein